MFCPVCGQNQISEQTRFCSRCGFLLTGIEQVVANEGNLPYLTAPTGSKSSTPRKKGLKWGLMIFLMTFLVVPLTAIVTVALNAEPFVVAMTAILFFMGGILRMVYALLFESNEPTGLTLEQSTLNAAQNLLGKTRQTPALPPQQSIPTSTYVPPAGGWRETNDLVQPHSVTDDTTKMLNKDKEG